MIFAVKYGWMIVLLAVLLLTYVQQALHRSDTRWKVLRRGLYISCGAGYACGLFNANSGIFYQYRIDRYLIGVEEAMGSPAFAVGRFVSAHVWLADTVWIIYTMLLIVTLAVFAVYLFAYGEEEAYRVLWAFMMNGALAILIYFAFPASGPKYAFPEYPGALHFINLQPLYLRASPNCIPSVHMSTALMVLWYLSRWRIGAVCGALFVVSTVLATLGLGEHYALDLILAIPYAAVMIYVYSPVRESEASCTTHLIEPSIS